MNTRTPAENNASGATTAVPSAAEAAKPAGQGEKVAITVKSGMKSEDITALLDEAGLLKDKKEFLIRLNELGMDIRLKVGTFEIVKGSDYDEIIKILTK